MAQFIPPGVFACPDHIIQLSQPENKYTREYVKSLLPDATLRQYSVKIGERAAYLIALCPNEACKTLSGKHINFRASVLCGHVLWGPSVLIEPDDSIL